MCNFCYLYASADAAITTKPEMVNDQNQTSATLSCNLTNPSSPIKGYYWTHNGKTIDKTESTADKAFIEHEYVPQPYVNDCITKEE